MKLPVGKLFWKEILRKNSWLQAGFMGAFSGRRVQKLPIRGSRVRGSFAGF
jgi:hypothetical protein